MIRNLTLQLLTLLVLLSAGCATARPVSSAQAACAVATERVTAVRHQPISHVASCDDIPEVYSPEGYYVLGLHGPCLESICGSTLMGWFAVRKADGKVFEYDVTEMKAGRPVTGEP